MRQEFLFSTGCKVAYDPINPRVIAIFETQRNQARPKPPVEIVEAEGPLKGTEQTNEADPDYIAELELYMEETELRRTEFYMRRARFEPLTEGWRDEVKKYREDMAALSVKLEEKNDEILWITDIACGDPDEVTDFMLQVTNANVPSAERRAALRDSFRADL